MEQSPTNMVIRLELMKKPHELWKRLCDRVNNKEPGTPPELGEWIQLLVRDASDFHAELEQCQESAVRSGATPNQVKVLKRSMRSSAKPSRQTLEVLSAALGKYELAAVAQLDRTSGRVERTDSHRASATNKDLIAFATCVAIGRGDWQSFRCCAWDGCDIFFYDHMPRGRPPQWHCCPDHERKNNRGVK